MVTKKGIEVNQAIMAALKRMTPPRSIEEVQSLNGRIRTFSHFIVRSSERSMSFFWVLKQKGKFEWTEECQ